VNRLYQDFVQEIKSGSERYGPLKLIHHLISGLKANYTQTTYETINRLREACGGAGFQMGSGLPGLLQEYSA
jgi:hypothetical protein